MLGIVCQTGLLWLTVLTLLHADIDIYWQDQEIIYDFRAQLQAVTAKGTGPQDRTGPQG